MRPRQFVTLVALCGTVALPAWGTARSSFGSFAVDNTATAITDGDATSDASSLSPEADALDARLATTMASLSETATSDPEPGTNLPSGAFPPPRYPSSRYPSSRYPSLRYPSSEVPVVEAPLLESPSDACAGNTRAAQVPVPV